MTPPFLASKTGGGLQHQHVNGGGDYNSEPEVSDAGWIAKFVPLNLGESLDVSRSDALGDSQAKQPSDFQAGWLHG